MGKSRSFKDIKKLAYSMEGSQDRHYKNMKDIYYNQGFAGVMEYVQVYEAWLVSNHGKKKEEKPQTQQNITL